MAGDFFGVHVPELQLSDGDFAAAMGAAGLASGEHYVELGSGHGRGLVIAARDFGARATGVEYLVDAIGQARTRARAAGVDVTLEHGDLRHHDVRDADVVLLHLGPAFHDLLAPRLERLLRPSARVVAAGWRVPGWQPVSDVGWDGGYVYRPADPTMHGAWVPHDATGEAHPIHAPDAPLPALESLGAAPSPGPLFVGFRAGADLLDIRVQATGAGVRASASRLGRGQAMLVAIDLALEGAPSDVSLEVHAVDAQGRLARRGPALPVIGSVSRGR